MPTEYILGVTLFIFPGKKRERGRESRGTEEPRQYTVYLYFVPRLLCYIGEIGSGFSVHPCPAWPGPDEQVPFFNSGSCSHSELLYRVAHM